MRTGALGAGVPAADVLLAAAIVNDRLTPLLGLLALALAGAVIVRWPMVGFAAALVLGASVFTTTVVVIPVGPTELARRSSR